jgi:putative membrane protein
MAFQEVTMKLSGWAALACVAVITIACDRGDNANRTASNRDNSVGYSATDRDDTANTTLTQGTSGQAARTSDTGTRSFAEQAMMANVAEIKLGELAQKKAQNAAVKDFAQMMVRDHTKAKNELKQAAKGIDEPKQLDAKHQALSDRLSKLSGAEFDREYMMAMVDGHREVKNMLEDHAKPGATATGTTGKTADNETAVNQWASKTLPAVEQHLQKAEQISSQVSK